jgi:hypothetical protein
MMELIFRHTPTTKRKNKSYFTKTPPLFIAKTARIKKKILLKRWYHVCDVL